MTGIHCPKCQSVQSIVKDTRHREGCIVRRRRCFKCGYRFKTREAIEPAKDAA